MPATNKWTTAKAKKLLPKARKIGKLYASGKTAEALAAEGGVVFPDRDMVAELAIDIADGMAEDEAVEHAVTSLNEQAESQAEARQRIKAMTFGNNWEEQDG